MVTLTPSLRKFKQFGWKIDFFASKGPAYYYIYGRWRLNGLLKKIKGYAFDFDQNLLHAVDLKRSDLQQVKGATDKGEKDLALQKLTHHFQTRLKPAFFFDETNVEQTISLIPDSQKEATIQSAAKICSNTFDFRGVDPVTFNNGIDWRYRPQENIDWTWDLNRHAYFETLGRAYKYTAEERYSQKFKDLLFDWLDKNPARLDQPNWKSVFEVAFRINVWVWAFYYFRSSPFFDHQVCLKFLQGLLIHGRYLHDNLELHVANNHLLLEAKALTLLGLLFPEFKEAKIWYRRGLKILRRQVQAQVCADGVHGELSSHYHRVISSELLEILTLLENNSLPLPTELIESFNRMIEFELWMTKPNGLPPLLSDSALADTFMRFSAMSGGPIFLNRNDLKFAVPAPDEATSWLLGAKRLFHYQKIPPNPGLIESRAFPDGGYFIMRTGSGAKAAYLAFDCGPFGYQPLPSHGHADALSFELYACGRTLLVDPGVYGTSLGEEWRNFFRGSCAHNTVVVDHQDQSVLQGVRRVYRPAQSTLHQWLTDEQFDFVDGSHNGYERLPNPITHRRQIFFVKSEYWVVIDLLTGHGKHCFDLFFHLMPDTKPGLDQSSLSICTASKTEVGLTIAPLVNKNMQAEIITGATNPIQGWVSCFSGEKQPAPVLRYRQEGVAPTQFCTVLYPHSAGNYTPVSISPLDVEAEPNHNQALTGLSIETDKHIDYLIIERSSTSTLKTFTNYQTDAHLLYIRHKKLSNTPVKVVAHGVDKILFQGQSLLGAEFVHIA